MKNVFKLNKSCFNSFTRKHKPFHSYYSQSGTPLGHIEDFKYLGVYFFSDLSWKKHIGYITRKVNGVFNFIKCNSKSAPKSLKEALYITNIQPILEHANALWDSHGQTLFYNISLNAYKTVCMLCHL